MMRCAGNPHSAEIYETDSGSWKHNIRLSSKKFNITSYYLLAMHTYSHYSKCKRLVLLRYHGNVDSHGTSGSYNLNTKNESFF